MGKIVYKEERLATAEDSPYGLAPGVKYYEVSVTSVAGQMPGGMDNMADGATTSRGRCNSGGNTRVAW